MLRLLFVILLALAPGAAFAQSRIATEVFAETPTGRLAGTLLSPAVVSDAAVLILPGSGPTDRDGNNPMGVSAATYRLLAEALAAEGVPSIRIDKRGIGASASALLAEQDLRFSTNVDDAVAWLEVLRARTGARRLFVLGHSEGALTAILVAQRRSDLAGVLLAAGPGRPAADVIREQLVNGGAPEPLQTEAAAILSTLRRGETATEVSAPLQALFRSAIQPYLRSWLFLDPAAELGRSRVPALVLQGDRDIQAAPVDAQRLAAARPGVRLVMLPGVNHVLKAAPQDRAGNIATYADPALPLGPGVVEAIVDFVRAPAATPPG